MAAPFAAADEAVSDPNAPAHTGPADSIDEIIITARKREENLQQAPLAVTAFSGETLQDLGSLRADDLQSYVPNLAFTSSANTSNSSRLMIRGVGNTDPIATRDPGVGIYLDGIYLAREQGQLLGLLDVERVEVLRGPQGTLFGRNTIGGAVQLITKKPSDKNEGFASLRVGNYGLLESKGVVNLQLQPERTAARFAFQTMTRDGYSKNQLMNEDTDDRKMLGGRLSLRHTPSDALEFVFTAEQTRTHTASRGGECRLVPALIATFPVPTAEDAGTAGGFSAGCNRSEGGDRLSFFSPVATKDYVDTWGLSSTVTWDQPGYTVKSLTSWRRQDNEYHFDYTFGQVNIGNVLQKPFSEDQISQEFNVSGKTLDDHLNWTGGIFALQEEAAPALQRSFVAFNLCKIGGPFAGLCAASTVSSFRSQSTALAAYGQVTYDVTDRLHFTTGLRRSLETKRLQQRQQTLADATQTRNALFQTDQKERFGAWTPHFNLSYELTDRAMAYATYSRGFKSGGFNGRPIQAVPATSDPFKQEIIDNYEIGFKSSWFDRTLVTNAALFHGNYDDIQLTNLSVGPGGVFASRVANAGKAVIRGAELEVQALPTPGLDLRIGLGLTETKYKKFSDINLLVPGAVIDRANEDFQNVPNFTLSLSGAYTFFNAFGLGDLTTRLNWHQQNGVNFGPAGRSHVLEQGNIGVLSGQLALTLRDGKTTIALFGENLFDRHYIDSGINFETGFAVDVAFYAPPRMFGIEVRRSFQ